MRKRTVLLMATVLCLSAAVVWGPRLCLRVAKTHATKGRPRIAVALFRAACFGRVAEGCQEAAGRIGSGEGVPKDAALALALWRRACDGGLADSCLAAASVLETGEGVTKDTERAAALYGTAAALFGKQCDSGDPARCGRLADLYLTGKGVAKNAAKGAELLQKACDGEVAPACSQLASLLVEGQALPKDTGRAGALRRRGYKLEVAAERRQGKRLVLFRTDNAGSVALDGLLLQFYLISSLRQLSPAVLADVSLFTEEAFGASAPVALVAEGRSTNRLLAEAKAEPPGWDAEPSDYDCLVTLASDSEEHTKYSYFDQLAITVTETWTASCRGGKQGSWKTEYLLATSGGSEQSAQRLNETVVAPKRGPILRQIRELVARR